MSGIFLEGSLSTGGGGGAGWKLVVGESFFSGGVGFYLVVRGLFGWVYLSILLLNLLYNWVLKDRKNFD